MDLEDFLMLEKRRLRDESQSLSARRLLYSEEVQQEEEECAALRRMRSKIKDIKCNLKYSDNANTEQEVASAVSERQQQQQYEEVPMCWANFAGEIGADAAISSARNRTSSTGQIQQAATLGKQTIPGDCAELNETFYYFGSPAHETESAMKFANGKAELVASAASTAAPAAAMPEQLTKSAKEWVNQNQNIKEHMDNKNPRKNEDDMEQWVSDTFYAYFPGYNNENQKRQNYLLERQRENQANFLKHQAMQPPPNARRKLKQSPEVTAGSSPHSNTTSTTTTTPTTTTTAGTSHTTDKTDLEIIVNNPNYVSPPKYVRGGRSAATRQRLLQDLRHTDFAQSNQATASAAGGGGDALGEQQRSKHAAEVAVASRKKDYQRELMQQIEEKRRSIELLREKERKQDEALTRRLQEQLRTIQLEEELEKEKMRADKVRFAAEQNRQMRDHLLAKLENDTKLLYAKDKRRHDTTTGVKEARQEQRRKVLVAGEGDHLTPPDEENKVYKYFSNSARREYRRGQPLPADVDGDFELHIPEIMQSQRDERECFHLSEKVCPLCDAPLRSYESCCLRCQRKLSLRIAPTGGGGAAKCNNSSKSVGEDGATTQAKMTESDGAATAEPSTAEMDEAKAKMSEASSDEVEVAEAKAGDSSFSLVCVNCERLYALCRECVAQSDVCRACNRKRHVCMNCRRTLCTFCLEEIACGRDTERSHVNDCDGERVKQQQHKSRLDTSSERSFKVLAVYDAAQKDSDAADELSSSPGPPQSYKSRQGHAKNNNNNNNNYIQNNLRERDESRPPYSINIERNSIFHPEYQAQETRPNVSLDPLPTFIDKQLSFDVDSSSQADEMACMERVRKETDRRLARYLKNYGDLTARSQSESRHRSTQTTPDAAARRDIVLHEEHNLSMPLLREMPRMTRHEASQPLTPTTQWHNQRKMNNLKARWEIPAVQKFSISSQSPRVLTQVGAIRKQLQAEHLLADDDCC